LSPDVKGFVVVLGQHLLEDGGSILLPRAQPVPTDADRPKKRSTQEKKG